MDDSGAAYRKILRSPVPQNVFMLIVFWVNFGESCRCVGLFFSCFAIYHVTKLKLNIFASFSPEYDDHLSALKMIFLKKYL